MRLMCDFRLDYDAMSSKLGVDFRTYFSKELASLGEFEYDGLIEFSADGLRVTGPGRLLVRVVAMRFDRFLTAVPVANMYSKTV
jgi:oxygen-independent coproporphyrinogen-3 oxidase